MCGIFATNEASRWLPHVEEIQRALNHRGPDSHGVWHDEASNLLLVHTRLEILGLGQVGAQPMVSGDHALAFNGEIYNFRHLATSDSASDTEVVLSLLRSRGIDALRDLDGMFALALADAADGSLLIARDPYGIKPLYVRRDGPYGIAIASAIPALVPARPRPCVSPEGLLEFLTFGHTTSSLTCWEGISKLPPSTWLSIDGAPRPAISCGRFLAGSRPILEPGAAVSQAVVAQMVSDVPLGTFLSGGVDSGLITAVATAHRGDLTAFTVSFPDQPAIDEADLAAHNARAIGCRHIIVPAGDSDLAGALPPLLKQHGEPLGDPAICATQVLSHEARKTIKVALTGEGSDEVFGGYARHRLAYRTRHLPPWRCSRLANAISARRGDGRVGRIAEYLAWGASSRGYAALAGAELSVLSSPMPLGFDGLPSRLMAPQELSWRNAIASDRSLAPRAYDLERWLPNTYLEKVDRSTMSAGLEGRVPMLSPSVVASALSVRVPSKAVLRDEAVRLVPALHFPRRKQGLAVPIEPFRSVHGQAVGSAMDYIDMHLGSDLQADVKLRSERSMLLLFRLISMGLFLEQIA